MNAIQKYFRYRQSLIDQYVKGDMTKSEYLSRNFDAVVGMQIEPFKNIDTVEKGLFNYQYYNAMAKDVKLNAQTYPKGRSKGTDRDIADESNYYYSKKDSATLAVLKLLNYENVSAYFITVRSQYLKGKLFEIIIEDHQMILHSANPVILSNLRKEGVFAEEVRQSLIDGYINQKY